MDSPSEDEDGITLKLTATYVLIGGTAAYGLKQAITSSSIFATGTFGFLLGHSLLGFVYTTFRNPPRFIEIVYEQTCWLAQIVPLALLNAEFYTLTRFPLPYAYAHLATPIPPTAYKMMRDMDTRMEMLLFTVLAANLASSSYLTLTKQTGLWTGGLIVLHALSTFRFSFFADWFGLQDMEVITFGLLLFTLFAVQGLREMKA